MSKALEARDRQQCERERERERQRELEFMPSDSHRVERLDSCFGTPSQIGLVPK